MTRLNELPQTHHPSLSEALSKALKVSQKYPEEYINVIWSSAPGYDDWRKCPNSEFRYWVTNDGFIRVWEEVDATFIGGKVDYIQDRFQHMIKEDLILKA